MQTVGCFSSLLLSPFFLVLLVKFFVLVDVACEVSLNLDILFVGLQILPLEVFVVIDGVEFIVEVDLVLTLEQTLVPNLFHPVFGHRQNLFGLWIRLVGFLHSQQPIIIVIVLSYAKFFGFVFLKQGLLFLFDVVLFEFSLLPQLLDLGQLFAFLLFIF